MSDTVKLIIEIPEEVYIHFLSRYKYQGTNDIGLSECENVGVAIKNGTPLDDVKAEIEEMRIKFMEQGGVYEHSAYGLDYAIVLLDNIGKESEE